MWTSRMGEREGSSETRLLCQPYGMSFYPPLVDYYIFLVILGS
jgi:hypothetical protein